MAIKALKKPKRNDPCPCGSGKKFKRCHGHPSLKEEIRQTDKKRRARSSEDLNAIRLDRDKQVALLRLLAEVVARSGFWARQCPRMSAIVLHTALMYWPNDCSHGNVDIEGLIRLVRYHIKRHPTKGYLGPWWRVSLTRLVRELIMWSAPLRVCPSPDRKSGEPIADETNFNDLLKAKSVIVKPLRLHSELREPSK